MSVQTALFRAVGDFAPLRGESSRTRKELADLESQANRTFGQNVQKGIYKTQQKMSEVGGQMTTRVTLPVVAAGAAMVHTFSEFDSKITQAGLKAGATEKQIKRMSEVALTMGANTTFSATEAAGALDNLAANGLNAQESMKALPGVTRAAQAANADLATTADIVSTAMNAFNIKASETEHVADVLTQAANTSAADIESLGLAFGNVGEVGARFGQNIEDVVGFVSRLVNLGVPAASAGTAIRQALTSLAAPSVKQSAVLKGLGIETRGANGELLQIPDLIDNVSKGLDQNAPAMQKYGDLVGMGEERLKEWAKANGVTATQAKEFQVAAESGGGALRDYALKTMFGVEGAKAFGLAIGDTKSLVLDSQKDTEKLTALQEGLSKTMGKKQAKAWIAARTEQGKFTASGADVVRAMGAMNKGADGVAKKFGDRFSKTVGAQIEQLGGAIETLAIRTIKIALPYLLRFTKAAVKWVDAIGVWVKENPKATETILKIVAAFALMGPVLLIGAKVIGMLMRFWKVISFVVKWAKIIWFNLQMLGLVLGLSVGWILLIVAAIVGLVAGFVYLWKNNEKFRDFWIGLWDTIKRAVVEAWERWIWPAMQSIAKGAVWLWKNGIKPAIDGIVALWKEYLAPAIIWLWGSVIKPYLQLMWIGFKTWWAIVKAVLKAAWWYLKNVIFPIFKAWFAVVKWVAGAIWQVLKLWWDAWVKPILRLFWAYLKNVVWPVLKWFGRRAKEIWEAVQKDVRKAWEEYIKPAFEGIKDGVKKVKDAFDAARKGIAIAWAKIKSAVRKPIEIVIDIINGGLIRPFNWLSEKLGSDAHIDPISKAFASGGEVPGQRMSGRSDRVPAMLTAGEQVIRQKAAKRLRRKHPGVMEYMNRYGTMPNSVPAYAGGGTVWPAAGNVTQHSGYPWASWAGDINQPGDETGAPVRAYRSGTVASALWNGEDGSYGNVIRLNHPGFGSTLYAHLSNIAVQAGQAVAAGQVIGNVGSTGNSSGPHLHFEIMGSTAGMVMGSGKGAAPSPWAGLAANVVAAAKDPLGFLQKKIAGGVERLRGMGPMGQMAAGAPGKLVGMFAGAMKSMAEKFAGGALDKGKDVVGAVVKNSPLGLLGQAAGVFDRGGVARGKGLIAKDTISPERVLDPRQTVAFERLVSGLLGPAPRYAKIAGGGSGSLREFAAAGGKVEQHFTWKVFNPTPETASESSLKTLTKVAQEGLTG